MVTKVVQLEAALHEGVAEGGGAPPARHCTSGQLSRPARYPHAAKCALVLVTTPGLQNVGAENGLSGTKTAESERGVWFSWERVGICTPHSNRKYALVLFP